MMRPLLERIYRAGVAACHPSRVVPAALPSPPPGPVLVLAAGKASAAMAQAVEQAWGDSARLSGIVVARHGYGLPLQHLELVEAAHPVPDAAGEAGARRMLAMAEQADADTLVLMLLSGGASALLSLPGPGLTLEKKRALTRSLLRSGAAIHEINCVRRHLSAIKGGRLAAAAHPARVLTLAISDVVGDLPEAIGSGPTVADPTDLAEAHAVLARYGIADPGAGWSETPKPGDLRLAGNDYRIIARPALALAEAARLASEVGYRPMMLGDAVEGEAREIGAAHAAIAREHRRLGQRIALISGGELTVTVTGNGRGGPNQEYALGLAMALNGLDGVTAFAGDTDGADGSHDVAGAFVTSDTLARARAAGFDPQAALANNDAGTLLGAIGDLLVTGPTQTNVNDLRVVLVDP